MAARHANRAERPRASLRRWRRCPRWPATNPLTRPSGAILDEARKLQADVRVRWEAAKALQRLNSTEAIAGLSEELKSGTTPMRKLVLDALWLRKSRTGGIRDQHARAAVPAIIEASRDPEMSVRFSALRIAAELEPDRPEVLQRLREAAGDPMRIRFFGHLPPNAWPGSLLRPTDCWKP